MVYAFGGCHIFHHLDDLSGHGKSLNFQSSDGVACFKVQNFMSFLEAVGRTKVDTLDDPTLLWIVGIAPPGVHKGSNFGNTFVFPIDVSTGEHFVGTEVTGNASLGRVLV